jgi:hypothetical protein
MARTRDGSTNASAAGRWWTRRPLVAALLVLSGMTAGCSSDFSADSGGAGDGAPAAAESAASGRQAADSAAGANAQPVAPQPRIAPARALVRTAEFTVAVARVPDSANRAGQLARANGGDVYSDDRGGPDGQEKADLVLKVDPDRLDAVLSALAGLGTERQRSTSTEDVTEEVADVDSRVATMRASIARVRALLSRASSVGDLVALEGELAKREAELESLQARQRSLDERVALATVTVHLVQEDQEAAAPAQERRGFVGGLSRGWDAFTTTMGWLLAALGTVLPFALIAGPAAVAWWWIAGRPRRGVATPAAAAPVEPSG